MYTDNPHLLFKYNTTIDRGVMWCGVVWCGGDETYYILIYLNVGSTTRNTVKLQYDIVVQCIQYERKCSNYYSKTYNSFNSDTNLVQVQE